VNANIERTISEVATWAYIVKELATVDPIRNTHCIFCKKYVVSEHTLLQYHDASCAWRQAKEFTEKSST
jgi:hypothetical protein